MILQHSRVAQLAEQVTVNHPVGGSNPSPGASNYMKEKGAFPFSFIIFGIALSGVYEFD